MSCLRTAAIRDHGHSRRVHSVILFDVALFSSATNEAIHDNDVMDSYRQ
jgi:hypothetical protein